MPTGFFGPNRTAALIEDLAARGWAYAPGALPDALVSALREDVLAADGAGALREARIGRAQDETRAIDVRRADIRWLDGASPAQAAFLMGCERLREAVNRELFAGLFEFEAHYARYPEGGFYARHLDAFRPDPRALPNAGLGAAARRSRVVSLVAFLNPGWGEEDGGELVLWEATPLAADGRPDLGALDHAPPAAVLRPEAGGLVLMMSETIPHEVRPARRERLAIAGWWRVNASIGGVVDPIR